MSTNTNSTANKAQFIFELSQSIKRLEQESKANRDRTDELESFMNAEFNVVKEAQAKQQQGLDRLSDGLKALGARVAALEEWRDSVVGQRLEHVEKKFADVATAMEQRLGEAAKQREEGTWGIFNKKFAAAQEDNMHERELVAQTWNAEFKTLQERVTKDMTERLAEFTAAGKSFRDNVKTIEKLNADTKKVDALMDRLTEELAKFETLRKETIAKVASGKLFVESAPTTESGKALAEIQRLRTVAEQQKESVSAAIAKLNIDYRDLSERLSSEMYFFKKKLFVYLFVCFCWFYYYYYYFILLFVFC